MVVFKIVDNMRFQAYGLTYMLHKDVQSAGSNEIYITRINNGNDPIFI